MTDIYTKNNLRTIQGYDINNCKTILHFEIFRPSRFDWLFNLFLNKLLNKLLYRVYVIDEHYDNRITIDNGGDFDDE